MDNTVNENWINKLIDELVDAKNETSRNAVEINQFYNLLKLIFNNARLDYSGENMMIGNEASIFAYLKVIDPMGYSEKLNALNAEREAEIAKHKAAQEAKANNQGEKKEA